MEKVKSEKAISQALASLKIDDIYISNDFLALYRNRNGLAPVDTPKIFVKRSVKNDEHK